MTVQQPTHLTATANLTIVAVNQPFTIYGTLTTADGAPVSGETIQLQKNVSGTWTDVSGKKNTTGADGVYGIVVSEGTVGVYEYRANFVGRATNGGSHSASAVVTVKPATQLTITVNPPIIMVNQTYTFHGSLSTANGAPMTSETIQLQQNIDGTWTDVSGKTDITSTTGSYSISLSESTAGVYEYRANFVGNEAYAGSNSASVVVTIHEPIHPTSTQLTASATPAEVNSKQYFTITGTLTDASSGAPITNQTIQLYKNFSGTWNDISGRESPTDLDGVYRIAYSEGSYGSYEYRTQYTGNATYSGSISASVVVTVKLIPPSKTPTNLTLQASPTTVDNATKQVTFTGVLTAYTSGLPNIPVTLQKNVSGTWVTIATNTTNTAGGVTFSKAEPISGTYHYRLFYAGNAALESSTSNEVTIISTVGASALASLGTFFAIVSPWAFV